ncbi:hypothetical protein A6F55_19045 [Prescottella equi]|uniref:hypothetical protein n=1 Tax=Rhodococcus hoagii TaxID=43767 RepID=UPI000A11106D|nr:hypothetical protein [Prescottella equi]ORL01790.1 hypothetical protein A6F55_19045 [Prescottella equi]
MSAANATSRYDPERWPLAPGNAPAEYEALSAQIQERWKVPLADSQLAIIRGAFSRARPAVQKAAS